MWSIFCKVPVPRVSPIKEATLAFSVIETGCVVPPSSYDEDLFPPTAAFVADCGSFTFPFFP